MHCALPHLTGQLEPLPTGMDWQGLRVLAFAGIGHPEKFFATLRGWAPIWSAPRHWTIISRCTDALMQRLEARGAPLGAQLVTTEKDAVRLPAAFRPKVLTLPVRLGLDDWAPLDAALTRIGL